MRRSNQLVLAGIAFFIIGVVIVLVVARDDGKGGSSGVAGSDTVQVLVAKEDIAANQNGEDVLDKVEIKRVPTSERLTDALATPSELSGKRLTSAFGKGEQIRSGGLQGRLASVTPPEGKQAVPVRFSNVPGGAEYVQAGDLVNVFQVVPSATSGTTTETPIVKLLLTNVQVLAVSAQSTPLSNQTTTAAAAAQTQTRAATGSDLTIVFALDTIDAEKVIFGSSIGENFLYLAKVGDKAAPSGATAGQTFGSILAETPDQAFQRESAGQ